MRLKQPRVSWNEPWKVYVKKPALLETDFVHLLAVPIGESSPILHRKGRKAYLRFYETHRNFSFPLKILGNFS
jgi:hypothetical protein